MERETPLSPSWTPLSPDTARAPRRASQYRLFPTVEATPPASPVTLQFHQSQRKGAASSRRRSSSLSSDTSRASHSRKRRTPPASSQLAQSASPPKDLEQRPQSALPSSPFKKDFGHDASQKGHPRFSAALPDKNVLGRSDSALNDSSISLRDHSISLQHDTDRSAPAVKPGRSVSGFNSTLSSLSPVAEHFQLQGKVRVRTKPRPNLRIAIHKDIHEENESTTRPLPPPKSPFQSGDEPKTTLHLSPETKLTRPESPSKQTSVSSSTSEQVEHLSGSSEPAPGGVPSSSTNEMPSRRTLNKPLPPIRPDCQRENSSDGAKSIAGSDITNFGPVLQAQVAQRFAPSTTSLPRLPSPKQAPRSGLRGIFSKNKSALELPPRLDSLNTSSSPPSPSVASAPTVQHRPFTPDASPRPLGSNPPLPNGNGTFASPRIEAKEKALPSPKAQPSAAATTSEPASKSNAALIAARAHVAALRNSTTSTSSRSLSRSSVSTSDLGARYRGLSDPLNKRPSTPARADALHTLKELSQECDGLHERYKNLRAERQKLSTSIIASLRDLKAGPEYADTILNDQLALAAVSSSMDICFAKLKSIELRKEDAISALVQQVNTSQPSPSDKIAAMKASSMAITRKPSTDSGIRFAQTGRSTPEPNDSCSTHRLTQPSMRTASYGSDLDVSDLRHSSQPRKHSIGDSFRRSDGEKQAPETIPEVVESPKLSRLSRNLEGLDLQVQVPGSATFPVKAAPSQPAESTTSSIGTETKDGEAEDEDTKLRDSLAVLNFRLPSFGNFGDLKLWDETPPPVPAIETKAAKVLRLASTTATNEHKRGTPPQILPPLPVRTTESTSVKLPPQPSHDIHDLETQLQSFPKPNVPQPRRKNTGESGSFLTNGSSADSMSEPDLPPPPRRRVQRTPYTEMKKRDPSAHTIKVYMDLDQPDDDDFFEYYNQLR